MSNNCPNSHDHLAELPELLQDVMCRRGLCKKELSMEFLNPDYTRLHDPFLFNDMQKAVKRILQAISKKEKIMIYSDFDADGIPGGVILKEFFEKVAYDNFENYIPHRNKEGYGFHIEPVRHFAKSGGRLIITVDVGISAKDTVTEANKLGLDVVITDHHEALSLPDAFAIINPKLPGEKYPFKELCGASVAWKLAQALLIEGKKQGIESFTKVPDGWEKWLLSLAAISTVADMVPLSGENREIVRFGLLALRKSPRPGLRALLKRIKIAQSELNEQDIAFSIAPKLNVASRLGDPRLAFELLSSSDSLKIDKALLEIERLSKLRKTESMKISREAKKRLKDKVALQKVLFTGDKSWNPALLGLSAGKLADEFKTPVCLWGQDESGVFKGSCRSGGKGHMAFLLDALSEHLLDFGGHEGAGGFSVDFDTLLHMEEYLNEAYGKLDFDDAEHSNEYYLARSSDMNWEFYRHLRKLAPFGVANPAPEFRFENVQVISKRLFGKNKEHLELVFKSKHAEYSTEAVAFFVKDEWKDFNTNTLRFLQGSLEKSVYAGRVKLRLKISELGF